MTSASTGFSSVKLPAALVQQAREARKAIEGYESCAVPGNTDAQADALIARFMAVEDNASLAQRVREVVADNRSKAGTLAA